MPDYRSEASDIDIAVIIAVFLIFIVPPALFILAAVLFPPPF